MPVSRAADGSLQWQVSIFRDTNPDAPVDVFFINNVNLPPRRSKQKKVLWRLPIAESQAVRLAVADEERVFNIYKERKKERKKEALRIAKEGGSSVSSLSSSAESSPRPPPPGLIPPGLPLGPPPPGLAIDTSSALPPAPTPLPLAPLPPAPLPPAPPLSPLLLRASHSTQPPLLSFVALSRRPLTLSACTCATRITPL